MHLPDGLLNAPTLVATGSVSAIGVGVALRQLRESLGGRTAPLIGVTAACVFAGQMLNFPVAAGVSGHLVGGTLAAVLLGPWAGLLVITIVLMVQSLLFADGGVLALGANVFNMGLIGALGGYGVYRLISRLIRGAGGVVAGAVIAAWFAVLVSAIACSVELAVGANYRLGTTLAAMVGVHSVIGVGEAVITGLVVGFVLRTRPDLLYQPADAAPATRTAARRLIVGLATASVIAALAAPLASEYPDGLEWSQAQAAEQRAEGEAEPLVAAAMPDYQFPGLSSEAMATIAAGLVGAAVVFGVAWGMARSIGKHVPAERLHAPAG